MTLAPAATAFQACNNQTGNMLANWRCSFDQPHTSAVTNAGYATGKAMPIVIGVVIVLAILAAVARARSSGSHQRLARGSGKGANRCRAPSTQPLQGADRDPIEPDPPASGQSRTDRRPVRGYRRARRDRLTGI